MTVRNTVHVNAETIRRQRVCQVCGRSIATVEQPYLGPPLRKGNAEDHARRSRRVDSLVGHGGAE